MGVRDGLWVWTRVWRRACKWPRWPQWQSLIAVVDRAERDVVVEVGGTDRLMEEAYARARSAHGISDRVSGVLEGDRRLTSVRYCACEGA